MNRGFIIKALILVLSFVGSVFPLTIIKAQSNFPIASYTDAYWIVTNTKIPGWDDTNFDHYDYYWPQMDSCGFTYTATYGDSTSFDNSAGADPKKLDLS